MLTMTRVDKTGDTAPGTGRSFSWQGARYLHKTKPALEDDDFIELRASRYYYALPICESCFLGRVPPVALPNKGLWMRYVFNYPVNRHLDSIGFGCNMARMATA